MHSSTPESAQPASRKSGLSSEEAARRLRQYGPNTTSSSTDTPAWRVLVGKFAAPVPCLLAAAIVLQLFLGEYIEAAVIGLLLLFNAALGFFQEGRAKATLAALRSRLALNASVLRDGSWSIVPAAALVPGDLIKLTLGSVVPADARIGEGTVLLDQSMLTGESMPIEADASYRTFAGALVRRGEALAEVTATGPNTRFGRAAELVRTAHVTSTQQKAVLRVVLYLAGINGTLAALLIAYAWYIGLPFGEIIPLALIAILASVPVALPATFTLATAVGAQALGKRGVLPTRLSAVDEAASVNVLCVDKTGTLTKSELTVAAVVPLGQSSEPDVLMWARLASSDAGLDPVDAAIRHAAARYSFAASPRREEFVPFDPAAKIAEAQVTDQDGARLHAVKGAFAHVQAMARPLPEASMKATALEAEGFRVLGVAVGTAGAMQLIGLIALSDPPRPEAASCLAQLNSMGVRVVMVTGDAPATAAAVARAVGLEGAVAPPGAITEIAYPEDYAIFAGVLPEDKFALVKALQLAGYTVGMCGDGANDAPALRQAQLGIAVSTATDVAKSAAGIVLTEPGLDGIVGAVIEGRVAFQRILTYTLRSILHKVPQVAYLAIGLLLTGHAILTPMLVVISMITGDFLAMSSTTDNVRPSEKPNTWKIGQLTIAGVLLGLFDLVFCVGVLLVGKDYLELDLDTLRTLMLVNLVISGQAIYYVVRERRRIWSSRPSEIVLACSLADLLIVPTLAFAGVLMAPLPLSIILSVFATAIVFAFALDEAKARLFHALGMR
ncbi:MAG TPA: HAD-IC family P-type ATPase [Bradyrhizobium sp.]|nr:HAD-IC family P-type ATPase [Bradyrhizobium sp.]HZR72479.1 HAD-IC family P-type ATPase [Bradyrhizobium sp.]